MRAVFSLLALCLCAAPAVATVPPPTAPATLAAANQLVVALNAETPERGVMQLEAMLAPDAEFSEMGRPLARDEWLERQTDGYIYNARLVIKDAYWTPNRLIVIQKAEPLAIQAPGPCCATESSFVTTFEFDGDKVVLVDASGPIGRFATGMIDG